MGPMPGVSSHSVNTGSFYIVGHSGALYFAQRVSGRTWTRDVCPSPWCRRSGRGPGLALPQKRHVNLEKPLFLSEPQLALLESKGAESLLCSTSDFRISNQTDQLQHCAQLSSWVVRPAGSVNVS